MIVMELSLQRFYITSVLILLSSMLTAVNANAVDYWNYNNSGGYGPDKWSEYYPDCAGMMQSPIDINTTDVLYDPDLAYFDFSGYNLTNGVILTLVNKGGHTAEVLYTGKEVLLKGGNLPADYRLVQFHFHWGSTNTTGSEHAMDGMHAPMELHLVHIQSRFSNASEAQLKPFGLAVLGFLFEISPENNTKYDELLSQFYKIQTVVNNTQDNETEIETFSLYELLPENLDKLDFYRYFGSLTTPPCYESVIWSVATEKIPISEYQLNIFRSLYDDQHKHLKDDFRPVQNIDKRTVITTKEPAVTEPMSSTQVTVFQCPTTEKPGNSASFLVGQYLNVVLLLLLTILKVLS
ncbi:carbonic anhydrase1 [Biomphalaria glabrata]|nr:carbonic anhydrase1 [Biomphalaria glabrata]